MGKGQREKGLIWPAALYSLISKSRRQACPHFLPSPYAFLLSFVGDRLNANSICKSFSLMNTHGVIYNAVGAVLRIALVLALVAAVWSIYNQLPDDDRGKMKSGTEAIPETSLQIILHGPPDASSPPLNLPVQLYPIDVNAAQNEFFSERRPGKRLDDFLAERMGTRAPIEARFDENGQVTVTVKAGPWWIHTTLPGDLNIEWRLRVNVSGSKQTVELTPDNAYTRTKSF